MYGRIESKWTLDDDCFQLAVTIPANTEGVVRLPAQSVDDITEHEQALDQVEGIREIRQEGDTAILTVGSGHYQFRFKAH
jgi:alpha-L-rhamnosidase